MTQSEELLQKLYDFYKTRYEGTELEDKFNAGAADLVGSNDIERGTYIKFCISNNIEPKTSGKKVKELKHIASRDNYSADGCGMGSSTYASDGCGMGSSTAPKAKETKKSSYNDDSCSGGRSSYSSDSCSGGGYSRSHC